MKTKKKKSSSNKGITQHVVKGSGRSVVRGIRIKEVNYGGLCAIVENEAKKGNITNIPLLINIASERLIAEYATQGKLT